MIKNKPIEHTATINPEVVLKNIREESGGKKAAARQWSLLVWTLADDSRPMSDDMSLLCRQIVIMTRSGNYQEISEFKDFVRESARVEEKAC